MANKQDYSTAIWQFLNNGRQLRREDYLNGDFVFFSSRVKQMHGFGFIRDGGIGMRGGEVFELDAGAELAFYKRDEANLEDGYPTVKPWLYKDEFFARSAESMTFSYHEGAEPREKDIILTENDDNLPLLVLWDAKHAQALAEARARQAVEEAEGTNLADESFSYWLVRVFQKQAKNGVA